MFRIIEFGESIEELKTKKRTFTKRHAHIYMRVVYRHNASFSSQRKQYLVLVVHVHLNDCLHMYNTVGMRLIAGITNNTFPPMHNYTDHCQVYSSWIIIVGKSSGRENSHSTWASVTAVRPTLDMGISHRSSTHTRHGHQSPQFDPHSAWASVTAVRDFVNCSYI